MNKLPAAGAMLVAFLANAAMAADIGVYTPPAGQPIFVPVYSWSGCYIGAEGVGQGGLAGMIPPLDQLRTITPLRDRCLVEHLAATIRSAEWCWDWRVIFR